jgi:Domain of unknown function (DUF3846)
VKTVIVIPADQRQDMRITEQAKEPKLQQLQDLVDGYIEAVPRWTMHEGMRCIAYANEEGKLRGLPFNQRATIMWWAALGQPVDDGLCGDIVLVVNGPMAQLIPNQ